MNYKSILKTLVLCCFIVFTSCSSDDDSTISAPFEATVDGVLYQGTSVLAAMANNGKYLEVSSQNSDGTISMSIILGRFLDTSAPVLTAGTTYEILDTDDTFIDYTTFTEVFITTEFLGGEITITDIDTTGKTISGTFSCIVSKGFQQEEKVVENGVFTNIPYID
jgi:hypothetical protein